MDLKPQTKPTGSAPSSVISPGMNDSGGGADSDPFKPDTSPPNLPPQSGAGPKKGGRGGKMVLMVLLVIILAAGVGYGVYYWQHQHVDKLIKQRAELQAQITSLNSDVASAKADAAKTPAKPSNDDLVTAAVTDYCQASVDPTTKKALVFTVNPASKKVLYSTSDKNFATLSGACAAAANGTDMKTYYVKYSGTNWVVLYAAASPDATMTKQYNIPSDFK